MTAKKKAAKRAAPSAPKAENPNITYTIRTIPRAKWERFSDRMKKEGRQVGWAIEHFVEKVGSGQYTFE
jgi:hypothetical protein